MAPLFKVDAQIVEIASLLHDYASVKDNSLYEDHHIHGPVEAEKILKRLGYPLEKIEAVKRAIAGHRTGVAVEKRSVEADCLANADAKTHIEKMPSLLYLAYMQHGMGIDEGAAWVRAKLERSWSKLRPDVQELVRVEYEAILKILPV